MKLPTTELNNFRYLVSLCLDQCTQRGGKDSLSCMGTGLYPGIMAHLVDITQNLYNYMKATKGQTPYFAGAGKEFFNTLDEIGEIAESVLKNRIPQRYLNTTGNNYSCLCLEDAAVWSRLQCDIRQYLIDNKAYIRLEQLDQWTNKEIDIEFRGWVNKLYSIYTYLKQKRDRPKISEIMNAYEHRHNDYIEKHKQELDDEVWKLLNRTKDCLRHKIIEDIQFYFSIENTFWKKVIRQAFDQPTGTFRGEDIASLLFEHQNDLLDHDDFEYDTYRYVYICEQLYGKQRELENDSTPEQPIIEIPDSIPADLRLYPCLEPFLPRRIKRSQIAFDLYVDGIVKAYRIIKPGRTYNSSWAHLFRVMLELKLFNMDSNKMNQSKFSEAILEVLSSQIPTISTELSSETIRKNVGDNLEILSIDSLATSYPHSKYLQELADCFDYRIKI